jgi:hypothetical protein
LNRHVMVVRTPPKEVEGSGAQKLYQHEEWSPCRPMIITVASCDSCRSVRTPRGRFVALVNEAGVLG